MTQGVFADGELVAFHTNLRAQRGSGGLGGDQAQYAQAARSASRWRRSAGAPGWHGALSADVIVDGEAACWIDVNPRFVEPGNAHRAGVDLVAAYVEVARGNGVSAARATAGRRRRPARASLTHQLLMSVLGAAPARRRAQRRSPREVLAAVRHRGGVPTRASKSSPPTGTRRRTARGDAARYHHGALARPAERVPVVHGRRGAELRASAPTAWRTLRDPWDGAPTPPHR